MLIVQLSDILFCQSACIGGKSVLVYLYLENETINLFEKSCSTDGRQASLEHLILWDTSVAKQLQSESAWPTLSGLPTK